MINVSILIHENVILSSACGPLDILARTNQILAEAGKPPKFRVELVSEQLRNIMLADQAQFICDKTLDEVIHANLVIVPAFKGEPGKVLDKNRAMVDWIKAEHANGAEIASLCVGSYFLAEAGLLNGKPCTSHWAAIDDLRRRYPQIKARPDQVLTDQDGIYTGGGAFSSLNLIVYLVEKFCGKEVGIKASKNFSIHMDHLNQAHFSVFKGQRQHGDNDIAKAHGYRSVNEHEIAMLRGKPNREIVRYLGIRFWQMPAMLAASVNSI